MRVCAKKKPQTKTSVKGSFFFSIAEQVEITIIIKIMLVEPVKLTEEKQAPKTPAPKDDIKIIMKTNLLPQVVSKFGPSSKSKIKVENKLFQSKQPKTYVKSLMQWLGFVAEKARGVPWQVGELNIKKFSFAKKLTKRNAKKQIIEKVRVTGALYSSPSFPFFFETDFFFGFLDFGGVVFCLLLFFRVL